MDFVYHSTLGLRVIKKKRDHAWPFDGYSKLVLGAVCSFLELFVK